MNNMNNEIKNTVLMKYEEFKIMLCSVFLNHVMQEDFEGVDSRCLETYLDCDILEYNNMFFTVKNMIDFIKYDMTREDVFEWYEYNLKCQTLERV